MSSEQDLEKANKALEAAMSLLALTTGEQWNVDKLIDTADTVKAHARNTLLKQGIGLDEADAIVEQRFKDQSTTVPADPTPPIVYPEHYQNPPGHSMTKADLKARADERKAKMATVDWVHPKDRKETSATD